MGPKLDDNLNARCIDIFGIGTVNRTAIALTGVAIAQYSEKNAR